jgi:hypothetical protein
VRWICSKYRILCHGHVQIAPRLSQAVSGKIARLPSSFLKRLQLFVYWYRNILVRGGMHVRCNRTRNLGTIQKSSDKLINSLRLPPTSSTPFGPYSGRRSRYSVFRFSTRLPSLYFYIFALLFAAGLCWKPLDKFLVPRTVRILTVSSLRSPPSSAEDEATPASYDSPLSVYTPATTATTASPHTAV